MDGANCCFYATLKCLSMYIMILTGRTGLLPPMRLVFMILGLAPW